MQALAAATKAMNEALAKQGKTLDSLAAEAQPAVEAAVEVRLMLLTASVLLEIMLSSVACGTRHLRRPRE